MFSFFIIMWGACDCMTGTWRYKKILTSASKVMFLVLLDYLSVCPPDYLKK